MIVKILYGHCWLVIFYKSPILEFWKVSYLQVLLASFTKEDTNMVYRVYCHTHFSSILFANFSHIHKSNWNTHIFNSRPIRLHIFNLPPKNRQNITIHYIIRNICKICHCRLWTLCWMSLEYTTKPHVNKIHTIDLEYYNTWNEFLPKFYPYI